jgi:chromosome segregation ATPase
MDEYDVFLDEVTRRETIKMMEAYIERPDQAGRQFILLTPQNLSHVTVSSKVRVKKMPQPDRRRSAHGLQQQTID